MICWAQVMKLTEEEHKKGGVLDMNIHIISTITSHGPGYLNKDTEKIVGFQTDKPFKRALQPNGGIRMAIKACEDNGYHVEILKLLIFIQNTVKHTTTEYLTYTLQRCAPAVPAISSPDFQMLTAAAVSLATTVVWRFMELTV